MNQHRPPCQGCGEAPCICLQVAEEQQAYWNELGARQSEWEAEFMRPRPEPVEKFLDKVALTAFGTDRKQAQQTGVCVSCSRPPTGFRDAPSRADWRITGLCQACQDEIEAGWGEE